MAPTHTSGAEPAEIPDNTAGKPVFVPGFGDTNETGVDVLPVEMDGRRHAFLSVPGCAVCELSLHGETAMMRMFFVRPGVRRQGIGRRLFREAVIQALSEGKVAMAWQVEKKNAGGLQFWRAMGGTIFFEENGYWWVGINLEVLPPWLMPEREVAA